MNFDRKHKFHRRIKSHSMRVIIMIDVVTCVYIKTQPETYIYIYIYYTYLPSPHHFLLSCLFSCFMAISYGQWLFWIWIGGIGLSLFKCGDWQCRRIKPQDLAWWVPAKFYYWYWDHIITVGCLLVQQSLMRTGNISPNLRLGH